MARSGCLPELECAINHFSGSPIFCPSLHARAARANCNRADLPLLARLGQPGKGARGASTACNTFGCIVVRRRQIIQITYRHSVSRGLLCRTESERRGTDGCAWLGGCLDEGRCQISSVPRFWLCLWSNEVGRWRFGDLLGIKQRWNSPSGIWPGIFGRYRWSWIMADGCCCLMLQTSSSSLSHCLYCALSRRSTKQSSYRVCVG